MEPHVVLTGNALEHDIAAGVGAAQPLEPVAGLLQPSLVASTIPAPSRSVRYTRAPALSHSSMTCDDGCPYEFPVPTEITATCGRVACTHAAVVPLRLPWWATFTTVTRGTESCWSQ